MHGDLLRCHVQDGSGNLGLLSAADSVRPCGAAAFPVTYALMTRKTVRVVSSAVVLLESIRQYQSPVAGLTTPRLYN